MLQNQNSDLQLTSFRNTPGMQFSNRKEKVTKCPLRSQDMFRHKKEDLHNHTLKKKAQERYLILKTYF